MSTGMESVEVGLGDRAYPIEIRQGILSEVGLDLARRKVAKRYAVVADAYVAELYGADLLRSLGAAGLRAELLTFPRGEASKNLETIAMLASLLAKKKFDRKDGIIALGGGVSGDLAGFLAAIYLRGIVFVQVPTTLLAQVDSSVGGKTGVDIPEGKNLVGAFYQPRAVYVDPSVLGSLPPAELLNGLAEVIKYGVIADAEFFSFLEQNRAGILALDSETLVSVIATCCRIKARVVAEDEREAGLRRILNFGHTIGHAVEAESGFTIAHGMAVAMGMAAAAELAAHGGLLRPADRERLVALLVAYGLPVTIPAGLDRLRIKRYMLRDKKTVGGQVNFVLPTGIGTVIVTDQVRPDALDEVLEAKA